MIIAEFVITIQDKEGFFHIKKYERYTHKKDVYNMYISKERFLNEDAAVEWYMNKHPMSFSQVYT